MAAVVKHVKCQSVGLKSERVLRETVFITNLYDLTVTHSKIELINHSQLWLE